MITPEEEAYILEKAYVPVSLIGEVRSTLKRKGYIVNAGTWQEALDLDPLMRLAKAGRWKQAITFLLSRLTVDQEE